MVLTALGLVAFLGLASLAVDMGHLYVIRNELQNVSDAAALAGANRLIMEQNGEAVRDSTAAYDAAMDVAQRQAELSGLSPGGPESRSDITISIGNWNIYTGNPDTAWTDSDGSPYSNANAVRVAIRRGEGVAFGPVANFLAGILGSPTSEVAATATAYLGFVQSAQTGAVDLPLAIPDSLITAANSHNRSWLAKVWGPDRAEATSPPTTTFKDLGSSSFYANNLQKPLFDTQKAYLVTLTTSDPVPGTINDNLIRQANSSSGTPVRPMARGSRLYPISEYQWASNISTIFKNFKSAYNKKQVNGKYTAMVPVYSTTNPMASRFQEGLRRMAGLFSFGPSPAHACFTFWNQSYPGGNVPIYVDGYANVNVTNVTYEAVASRASDLPGKCDDCSPYAPALNGQNYKDTVDCMINNPESCRNQNSVTVEIPVESTVSNPGTSSGGPDNQHINPSGAPGKGAFAKIAKLVK